VTVFKGGSLSASGNRTGLGAGFGGLADYLANGPRADPNLDRVEWTEYRNLDGIDNPHDAAQVMRAHVEEMGDSRVEQPVYHFGLSLAEGEHLSQQEWSAAIDRVLERMGLADHQAVVIAHNDTPYEHVHIMVNRVGEDGRTWEPWRDMTHAREAVRAIERDYGLQRTGPKGAARDLEPPALSSGSYAESRRTGRQPFADQVREQAAEAFAQATSWRDLEQRLADHGFRLERAERGSGVVVTDGHRRASLSQVDRNLSGPKLAERFGETFKEHRAHTPEPPRVTPAPGREIEPLPGATIHERAAALVERVSATRASFSEADLKRAAFYQDESVALVRTALADRHVLELGKDAHGAVRYASREYVEVEARMFGAAGELAARANLRLDAAGVGQTLERFPHFSDEQRAAVLHATTGEDLAQVVGRAGAGKTSAARAIAEAYRDQGYEVRGAALAGKAAAGLQAEAGIPSRTLASLEHGWDRGRDALHPGAVLVIDEAGMVDARQLSRVLEHAQARAAKVVLLGDPAQLKAIGAGDAYRGLLETHPSASLETIRRQVEPWQQQASEHFAGGRVRTALDVYDQAGRLHWTDSRAEARAELVTRYLADRAEHPAGSQLIVTYRNADARAVNDEVRAVRRAAGELAQPAVTVGGREYTAGDRLVFLRNDHQGLMVANVERAAFAGVKNGTLGTVEHAAPGRIGVRLDDGRAVAFDPQQYKEIAHGYAVTIHKSQGVTVDRAYALADPMMDRHAAYVAMTRHRESVRLYADRETFSDRQQLDRALSRESRKDLARDYGAADLEAAAGRVNQWQERSQALRNEEQSLRFERDILGRAQTATSELGRSRAALEQDAGRVYANPQAALRALLADPHAAERLAAGQAHAYGPLRGRALPVLGGDRQRQAAVEAVPTLRWRLDDHRHAERTAAHAVQLARQVGASMEQIQARLGSVATTLQQVRAATGPAEKALERVVMQLGSAAVKSAISLLPKPLELPLRAALRAIDLALDLGRGLGRDLGLGR